MGVWMPSRAGNDCTPKAAAVELAQLGEGCRGQAAPCINGTIRKLFDLREIRQPLSALRKKQNDTKYRNLEKSGCKLEYQTGRTADTGEQRSVFAGWFRQGFPRRRFLIPSKSNGFPKKTFSNIF